MLRLGPLQGFECFDSPQNLGMHRGPLNHYHHHQQPEMDDLSEMFTLSSLPEVNSMSKLPWDHNSSTNAALSHSNLSGSDMMAGAQMNQQQQGLGESFVSALQGDINSVSQAQLVLQEAAANDALRRMQEESCKALGLTSSPSIDSSQVPSNNHTRSSAMSLPTWHHPYMRSLPLSPLGLGQVKMETMMVQDGLQNSSHTLGRGTQDCSAKAAANDSIFIPVCGMQASQLRTCTQPTHLQVSAPPYASQTGLGQPQGAAAVVAGTARPRVRARRGQATDPHSIAERLRRERIADRMKALQELVPNANKTDKASMLDEIIEYVRFLQLQVKILSMSRLSGTSGVGPLVADFPAEESMVATERQVAKLMEESMGSALQFLQSKGLCLMPISLATAMSTNNVTPSTNSLSGLHGKTEPSSNSIRASSNASPSLGNAITMECPNDQLMHGEVSSAPNRARSTREAMIMVGQTPSLKSGNKLTDHMTRTNSLTS